MWNWLGQLNQNESKIRQVIGRSIRYESHSDLPKSERHVDIYRWISVFPNNIKNISADEYLRNLSLNKEYIENLYITLIENSSIEKNYYQQSRNIKEGSYKNSYLKYKRKYKMLIYKNL